MEKFICKYCGKEFNRKSSLSNHIKSCNKQTVKNEYKFICKKCNKEYSLFLTESEFNKGYYTKYCSLQCRNSHDVTDKTKNKISELLLIYNKENPKEFIHYTCKVCGKEYKYLRGYSTKVCCCHNCSNYYRTHKKDFLSIDSLEKLSEAGKKGCNNSFNLKRSKAEIYFYELCRKYFDNVLSNERMFNGWDADIILPDYKIAILYNGKWHYEEISKHVSLIQIQNRDKIKESEIRKCGYIPYIIKDLNKFNKLFVEEQFNLFMEYIKEIYRGVPEVAHSEGS